jgi:hypothetical protein
MMQLIGEAHGFLVGLGATQVIDALFTERAAEWGEASKLTALALDTLIACGFATFGILARRRHAWAFLCGMSAYAVDAGVLVWLQSWPGVAVHALALFFLWRGLTATRALASLVRVVSEGKPTER